METSVRRTEETTSQVVRCELFTGTMCLIIRVLSDDDLKSDFQHEHCIFATADIVIAGHV